MTRTTPGEAFGGFAATTMTEPRLFRGTSHGPLLDFFDHTATHGQLPTPDLAALISWCEAAKLAGRGGAGFPVATKLAALPPRRRPVVVVNGTENEPASQKDRVLMGLAPHLILDGAMVVANATRASRVVVAVHDPALAEHLRVAARQRPDGGRLTIETVRGGFVVGEARALLRALAGGPPIPPGRKSLPTERGLGGLPTFVSNVETFAQIALLARLGPAGYASVGTANEPGTTLITVSGGVARPMVAEIAIGTALGSVLAAAEAGPPASIVTGGYHGTWLQTRPEMPLSRAGVKSVGGSFGAGVVMVVDGATCALGELKAATDWLAAESAGQCGPCMFGLPALAADIGAMLRGDLSRVKVAQRHAAAVTGRGACAHPDGAARFVNSALGVLGRELEMHGRHGGCQRPVLGRLPVPHWAKQQGHQWRR
jgi:NADH:ubiquinone oxidoreductase subunit F (NADH-binding)